MSNVKILNLDELNADSQVEIVLNGKKHQLVEMNVQNFVWVQKEMSRIEKTTDPVDHFTTLVEILARQFPTASAEEFHALPLVKLRVLMDFVNNLANDGAEAALSKVEDSKDNAENPPTAAQAA